MLVLRDWSLQPIMMTALWLKDRITAEGRSLVEAFEHTITHRAPNKSPTEIRYITARDQDHGAHTQYTHHSNRLER
jgi:hypothetical protein